MNEFFKELFEYSHYCNQKLADIFNDNPGKTSEKAVKLFSHVLNAHRIWNNRMEAKQKPFGIWEQHPVQNMKSIDQANYEESLLLLGKADLNKSIMYSTSKGEPFTSTIRDIFFHIINHSTYHRGQIATEFRQHGLTPLITDYIFYKRQ